jgi:outer membrane receptor protein involved in Fe transport
MGGSIKDEDYSVLDRTFNRLQNLPPDFLLTEAPKELGFWTEGEITLSGKLNLFAGLRYAKFEYEDNMEEVVDQSFMSVEWLDIPLPQGDKWLPRVALNWKPVDPLNLRFTYGQGYRQPPATFEEVCCGRRFRGNRGTEMEESTVYGLEITYQPTPKYQLNVSAFRTSFDNLVVKLASWVDRYVPTYQNASMPEARFDSAALQFRWDPAEWVAVRLGGTWTDPQNLTEDGNIPVLRDRYGRPQWVALQTEQVPYVNEYTGNLSVLFRHAESQTSFGFTAQLSGPQLIQEFPQDGLPNTFVPTESYEVYNFSVTKGLGKSFEIFAGIDNIGEYLEATIADPRTDYTWGPLRGRYYYGGVTYRFAGL